MPNYLGVLAATIFMSGCAEPPAPAQAPSRPTSASRPNDAKSTRAQLTAVIRAQSYLDALSDGERAAVISEPFVANLVIVYMVDEHGAARIARTEDLTARGVTMDALRAVAEWNVGVALRDLPSCEPDAVTALPHGNFYQSSRLLLDKQWADLAASRGTVVVAVPTNDALFVTCSASPNVLKKLSIAVQNSYPRAAHPVSPSLLTWTADGWRELAAPPP